jgi:hypothetical protein
MKFSNHHKTGEWWQRRGARGRGALFSEFSAGCGTSLALLPAKLAAVDELEGAGKCDIDGGANRWQMTSDDAPAMRRQDDDGDASLLEILLIREILVGGDKYLEIRLLSNM